MRLGELLEHVPEKNIYNFRDAEVKGITYDSRRVRQDFLFVCLRGEKHDGHKFAADALERGACAVVCERRLDNLPNAIQIIVPDTHHALAQLASAFWGHPSYKMRMVGVTGTNGKTTITYLCEALLRRAGYPVGVVGSISYRWDGREVPSNLTTPFSSDLQEMLASMHKHGCRYVIMEVSSHALAQGRVEGVEFDVAVFTNLTQDHLDYHKTMKNYLEAKKHLFEMLEESTKEGKYGLVNRDDGAWKEICAGCNCEIITYGIEEGDIRAEDITVGPWGTEFTCQVKGERFSVHTPLVGRHNVYNLLVAIGFGLQEGLDRELIVDVLANVKPAPGRFEKVWEGDFTVVVDYAGTGYSCVWMWGG